MNQNQKKPKILVNGCSHTRAQIPNNEFGKPWPTILSEQLEVEVVNLAKDGKANHQIVEETIRYLINRNDFTHVVIQLNEWIRYNFFKRKESWTWEPGDIESQFPKRFQYIKVPTVGFNDLNITRSRGNPDAVEHEFGDLSRAEQKVVIGTMVNCLSQLCRRRGIGLTIVNYHGLGDFQHDPVWKTIPAKHFLIKNIKHGLYNDMLWKYSTPDTFHFEHQAHFFIARSVRNHYKQGKQITVETENYDAQFQAVVNRIFDYS